MGSSYYAQSARKHTSTTSTTVSEGQTADVMQNKTVEKQGPFAGKVTGQTRNRYGSSSLVFEVKCQVPFFQQGNGTSLLLYKCLTICKLAYAWFM
jgi:hypothetical protein